MPGGRSGRSVVRSVGIGTPDGPRGPQPAHQGQRRATDRGREPGDRRVDRRDRAPERAPDLPPVREAQRARHQRDLRIGGVQQQQVLGHVAPGPVERVGQVRRRVEHLTLAADVGGDQPERRGLRVAGARQGGEAGAVVLVEQAPAQGDLAGQAIRVADGEGRVAEGADAERSGRRPVADREDRERHPASTTIPAVNGALLLASIPAPRGSRDLHRAVRHPSLRAVPAGRRGRRILDRHAALGGGGRRPGAGPGGHALVGAGRAHRRQALPRHHQLRPARGPVVRPLRDLGGRPGGVGRRAGGRPGGRVGHEAPRRRACWR